MKLKALVILFGVLASPLSFAKDVVTEEYCTIGGGTIITSVDQSVFPHVYTKVCMDGKFAGSNIGLTVNIAPKECLQALKESAQFKGKIIQLADKGEFFLQDSDGSSRVVTKSGVFKINAKATCIRDQSLTADDVIAGLAKQAESERIVKQACRDHLGAKGGTVVTPSGRQ